MLYKNSDRIQTNILSIPKPSRLDKFIRLGMLRVFLWMLIFLIIPPTLVKAEPLPPNGLIPVPEGEAPIRLTAFTVDAYFQDQDDTWQYLVRFRLYNPSKTDSVEFRFHLQGNLPDGSRIAEVYGEEGYVESPSRRLNTLTITRTFQPEERVWYTISYKTIAARTPWAHFTYALQSLTTWPKPVDSTRVTLHVDTTLNLQAYLRVRPTATRLPGNIVEWQWENQTPTADIDALFIRPKEWQRIEHLRQAAQKGEEKATETLARLLTQWLTQEDAPPEVVQTFYPEALALWTQIAQTHPADPSPWKSMITLYRVQERLTHNENMYRPLILAALREAWKRGDRSEKTREELATLSQAQIDYLLHARRWREALDQIQAFSELLGTEHQEKIQALRRQVALAWLQERLQAEDWPGVREAIQTGWGPNLLTYFRSQAPSLHSLSVEVLTTDHTRTITITAALAPTAQISTEEAWHTFLSLIPTALPQAHMEHEQKGHVVRVQIRLPFPSADDLQKQQRRLVGILPNSPEWEVVRDALNPRALKETERKRLWGWTITWEEEVTLAPSKERLDQTLDRLRATLMTPPSPDFPEELRPVRQRFQRKDIEAWEEFEEHIHVVYTLKWTAPPGPPEARKWTVRLGEHLLMQAERTVLAPARIVAFLALSLLGWTVLSLLLRRWLS